MKWNIWNYERLIDWLDSSRSYRQQSTVRSIDIGTYTAYYHPLTIKLLALINKPHRRVIIVPVTSQYQYQIKINDLEGYLRIPSAGDIHHQPTDLIVVTWTKTWHSALCRLWTHKQQQQQQHPTPNKNTISRGKGARNRSPRRSTSYTPKSVKWRGGVSSSI